MTNERKTQITSPITDETRTQYSVRSFLIIRSPTGKRFVEGTTRLDTRDSVRLFV